MNKEIEQDFIDKISSSFCLAKWKQVTIDLEHGTNHSCHHPLRHKTPLSELKESPAALHNTKFKFKQREKMLKGERPAECIYCWKVEDSSEQSISDRYLKSNENWAKPYLNQVLDEGAETMTAPSYMEVFFSSTCNLSCSYCMADISSSIRQEMNRYGAYPVSDKRHRLEEHQPVSKTEEDNPYVKAFWDWFPVIVDQLQVFRVTGGEPLLSPNTWRVFDFLKKRSTPLMTFAINTNLSIPDERFHKFLQEREEIEGKIKAFELYTSLDTFGVQAEYIRSGLDIEKFVNNLEKYLDQFPTDRVTVMCAFNLLSIPQFRELIKFIQKLKERGKNLFLDISYIKDPHYLSPVIADETLIRKIEENVVLMEDLASKNIFEKWEALKLRRILQLVSNTSSKQKDNGRYDFVRFIPEYDRRKNQDFKKLFPELREFFLECEKSRLRLSLGSGIYL